VLFVIKIAAGVALGLIVFDDLKKHADDLKVSVLTLVRLLAIHIIGRAVGILIVVGGPLAALGLDGYYLFCVATHAERPPIILVIAVTLIGSFAPYFGLYILRQVAKVQPAEPA
jgi:hypothetical protein